MRYNVYVDSYMGKSGSDGLYLLELDTQKKEMKIVESYPEYSDNPSYLTVTENHLLCCQRKRWLWCDPCFWADKTTGKLTFLNCIQTEGSAMCHLTAWPDGRHLSAANYMMLLFGRYLDMAPLAVMIAAASCYGAGGILFHFYFRKGVEKND